MLWVNHSAPSGPATMPVGATLPPGTAHPTAGDRDADWQGSGCRRAGENVYTPVTSSVYQRLPSRPTVTSWGNAPLPAPGPTPAGCSLSAATLGAGDVVVDAPTWTWRSLKASVISTDPLLLPPLCTR